MFWRKSPITRLPTIPSSVESEYTFSSPKHHLVTIDSDESIKGESTLDHSNSILSILNKYNTDSVNRSSLHTLSPPDPETGVWSESGPRRVQPVMNLYKFNIG